MFCRRAPDRVLGNARSAFHTEHRCRKTMTEKTQLLLLKMFTSTSKNVQFNIPTVAYSNVHFNIQKRSFQHPNSQLFLILISPTFIVSWFSRPSLHPNASRAAGCKQRVRTFDPSTRSEIQVENIARIDSALTLLQNRHDFVIKWSHINALSNMFLPSCLDTAACAPVWSASSVQRSSVWRLDTQRFFGDFF